MKKGIIWTIILMAVATIISVAVVSCKKDNNTKLENNNVMELAEIDDMDEYLTSFRNRLLSTPKGEEFISLAQARRDLGNLLNFDFGDAGHDSNVFQSDTIRTKLVITNGQVDLAQLANTYRDAYELIEKAYEQVSLPEKSVYTIYCTFRQEDKNSETVDVMIVLTTRGLDLTSKDMCTVPLTKSSIDPTDCWSVDFDRGRCNGTDVGFDHVDILQLVYKNSHVIPMSCPTGRLYYSDEGSKDFKATDYPETGLQFFNYGFRLWTGTYNNWIGGYVVPDEMSYYFDNLCDIIDDYMNDSVNNNEIVINTFTSSIGPSGTWYCYKWHIEYGKPNCTSGFDQ
jgi:hypothetical protein